jgi:hypothetical protein
MLRILIQNSEVIAELGKNTGASNYRVFIAEA